MCEFSDIFCNFETKKSRIFKKISSKHFSYFVPDEKIYEAVLSFRQDLINEMKSQIQSNSANVLGGGHMGRKVFVKNHNISIKKIGFDFSLHGP